MKLHVNFMYFKMKRIEESKLICIWTWNWGSCRMRVNSAASMLRQVTSVSGTKIPPNLPNFPVLNNDSSVLSMSWRRSVVVVEQAWVRVWVHVSGLLITEHTVRRRFCSTIRDGQFKLNAFVFGKGGEMAWWSDRAWRFLVQDMFMIYGELVICLSGNKKMKPRFVRSCRISCSFLIWLMGFYSGCMIINVVVDV